MFEESYDIDISRIKDSDRICWDYTTEPPIEEDDRWFEATNNMYCKLSAVTEALATSSDHVHLSILKPSNILEWYYRLNALFDAGIGFLYTDTPEGEVPIQINITDLKDHLGLRLETNNWDTSKFDKCIRNTRMQNHLREIL